MKRDGGMAGIRSQGNNHTLFIMIGRLKNFLAKKSTPRVVEYHIDEPETRGSIERSSFRVRGWVTFDKEVSSEELVFWLIGSSKKWQLSHQCRPDVSGAKPGQFAYGFFSCVDYLDIFPSTDALILEIEFPQGKTQIEIGLTASDVANDVEGYFRQGQRTTWENSVLDTEILQAWREDGYLLLSEFFSNSKIDEVNEHINQLWAGRERVDSGITIDAWIDTPRQRRMSFASASDDVRSCPYKLNDLFLADPYIREVILDPRLAGVLRDLLEGDATICSSLFFEYGSEQSAHYDTFYMAPLVKNRMLATWVALEDVDLASGPLFYYPRSHHIAPYRFRDGRYNMTPEEADQCFSYVHDTIKKEGISQTPLIARKGDVFIWHAHLLHGGATILDRTRTRRSLVTHFFRHGDPMGGMLDIEFQKNRFYLPREFLSAEES